MSASKQKIGESLYAYSVRREAETGEDSIPTIEEHYRVEAFDGEYTFTGVYECVFPDCRWRSRDPEKMWRHVHESPKHRHSSGESE